MNIGKRIIRTLFFSGALYLILFCSSCVSYKNVPYFQDIDSARTKLTLSEYKEPKIEKSDILGIFIQSTGNDTQMLFGTPISETETTTGFLVNNLGNITLPNIGTIKAEGLTTIQLADTITRRAARTVNNPIVAVKILNFRVSVQGEVNRSGVYPISNSRVTVLEALAMAGDLRSTSKRNNVLIIRESQGQLEHGRINLNSKDVFNSPYFYLKNNDIIYVEPDIARLKLESNLYRNIGIVVSITTIASVIINLLK